MKVPPFGKPLKELLCSGSLPNNSVWLYVGKNAWQAGKNTCLSRPTRTLVLPPNASPLEYDWPVNGCSIVLVETAFVFTVQIEHLINILFSYEATGVALISADPRSKLTFYKKDF